MKAAILIIIVSVALLAVICMVKFATDITVQDRSKEFSSGRVHNLQRFVGVVALHNDQSMAVSERFPYVAAIMRNHTTGWSFACFGSVILVRWLITAAHCRSPGSTHRVLLHYDYIRNLTHTYPVLFWRIHEKFNINNKTPKYDIAVAKINVDTFPFSTRPALFGDQATSKIEGSVWKTVSTMDRRVYLTSDFEKFDFAIADVGKCYESYGIEIDDSMICVDMSMHGDCFVTEFGPIFSKDRVIGVLAVQPRECDNKLAIFTNVSSYAEWILKTTRPLHDG